MHDYKPKILIQNIYLVQVTGKRVCKYIWKLKYIQKVIVCKMRNILGVTSSTCAVLWLYMYFCLSLAAHGFPCEKHGSIPLHRDHKNQSVSVITVKCSPFFQAKCLKIYVLYSILFKWKHSWSITFSFIGVHCVPLLLFCVEDIVTLAALLLYSLPSIIIILQISCAKWRIIMVTLSNIEIIVVPFYESQTFSFSTSFE